MTMRQKSTDDRATVSESPRRAAQADRQKDNWKFLARELPEGFEFIEFLYAAGNLGDGFHTADEADNPKAVMQLEKYCHVLSHETRPLRQCEQDTGAPWR